MKTLRGFIQAPSFFKSIAGFTLIELLVVIAVLGVLATGLMVLIDPIGQMAKTRDSIRKTTLRDVSNAIERYRISNGQYPTTPVGTWCGSPSTGYTSCGADWIPGLVTSGEIKELPSDPRSGTSGSKHPNCVTFGPNEYAYRSDGDDYKLMIHCTPENYEGNDIEFIDPWRDGDATWGSGGVCGTQVSGPGNPWAWAVWSSDVSKCW